MELWIRHPDGEYRHCITRVKARRDRDGASSSLVSVTIDITGHKRAKKALKQSEAHYTAVVETAFDAVVTMTADGIIRSFNQGAERIFGYPAEDAVGRPVTLLMPERFRASHETGLNRYLTSGESRVVGQRMLELAGRRESGEEFPLELSIAEVREGDEVLFTGNTRDLTERVVGPSRMIELRNGYSSHHLLPLRQ